MKRISEKLKSRGGASLIIALILALVAIFVGGSVLAAATVNGGRLAHRRELQQAYLSQRSAAKVISEELTKSTLSLTVLQNGSDGVLITAVGAAAERSPITELFYESVACKYLTAQHINIADVAWENFQMDEATNQPVYYSAMVSGADYQSDFTFTDPSGKGEDLSIVIRVDNDAATEEKERYTVYFAFPSNGQLRLKVRASQQHDTETGENRFSWSSPSIIKEGSDN